MPIVFYPEVPHDKYVVRAICRQLGREVIGDLSRAGRLVVAFCDRTVRDELPALGELPASIRVVNRHACDIRKSRVERAFRGAFGYASLVDPLTFAGPCVTKSEINARRDGRIIQCPITEVDEHAVYQRAIDNREPQGWFRDLRVPVFDGGVPFVYVCDRTEEARFRGPNSECRIAEPGDVVSGVELRKIAEVCADLGFDYGELDVVRDARDGRLYVLDANHTPYGPPSVLTTTEQARAVARLAAAFAAGFGL